MLPFGLSKCLLFVSLSLIEGSSLNNPIRSIIAQLKGSPIVPGYGIFEKRGQVGSVLGRLVKYAFDCFLVRLTQLG